VSLSRWRAWTTRWRMRGCLMLGWEGPALACALAWRAAEPEQPQAWASVGFLHASRGQWDSARAALEGCVLRAPTDAQVWFNLAYVCESQADLPRAEAAFRQALQLAPGLDRAWYGLGLCLIRQQRLEEAVIVLRRSTELQPMSPLGWYQLARVHADRAEWGLAERVVAHLQGFEPRVAERLRQEIAACQGRPLGEPHAPH